MDCKLFLAALVPLLSPAVAAAQQAAPYVELVEDDVEPLIPQLRKNPGRLEPSELNRELCDVFSGACCVRASNFQRYTTQVQKWSFTIAENPRAGEYRFLRFAWKRTQGAGIMF